jgi:hypothetical protein
MTPQEQYSAHIDQIVKWCTELLIPPLLKQYIEADQAAREKFIKEMVEKLTPKT